jgi:hypothetical protein
MSVNMIYRSVFIFLFALGGTLNLHAQSKFSIVIEPYQIPNLPGLQSFAAGHYNGNWLVLGGRLDGLHLRQPNQSFAASGNSTNIYVLNPESKQVWSASVNSLPVALREQLQSTNMGFTTRGKGMFLTGGYGYSSSTGNHITHNALVVIDMAGVMQAIINGQPIASFFRTVTDDYFAVTGGQLGILGDTLLLVGGHRFDGRYNPNNTPSFTQTYTNQIRKFMLADNGESLAVSYKEAITNAGELHRRDYNMAPQVFPDGRLGYTAFSGVFQVHADLPFLNTVDIHSTGYAPKAGFEQLLNHYHSGKLSVYDAAANEMHTIFFGGMAQFYYDAGGNLVKDDQVPFVSTIGKVTRNGEGLLTEEKLGDLPGLLGSGAEFLLNHQIPLYANEVIKLNQIDQDTVLVGYLYGGIESMAPNIFFVNNGTQSAAVNRLFKVMLVKQQNVLPLKLVYFRGRNSLQGNRLEWQVNDPDILSGFVAERSTDGLKFADLAMLNAGAGGSGDYTFTDNSPSNGLNYYRLRLVKKDGRFLYSSSIILQNAGAFNGVIVYPNPARDMLTIEMPLTTYKKASLCVMNVNGQILLSRVFAGGMKQLYLSTASLSGGYYQLQVELDGKLHTVPFIRE